MASATQYIAFVIHCFGVNYSSIRANYLFLVFEPSDENELAYTQIHKEYGELVSSILDFKLLLHLL